MPWRSIALPEVLEIEAGILGDLAQRLGTSFDLASVAVVTGGPSTEELSRPIVASLQRERSDVRTFTGTDGTVAEAERIIDELQGSPPSLIVAIGGGQPIDVAKLVGARTSIDVVVVPTALSHDGMASPVVSLTHADGIRRSIAATMPAGVVVDLEVVRAAPEPFLRAGVGDLISNLTAVLDWRLAARTVGEPFDEFAASIATHAAESVLEMAWPPSDRDLQTIAQGLVVSGLSMEVAGSSRPCSGAEHLISHALDQRLGEKAGLHGRQVALGSLITSRLHDAFHDELQALLCRIGLLDDLAHSGLSAPTIVEAVLEAPATRPDRYTILDETPREVRHIEELVRIAVPSIRTRD